MESFGKRLLRGFLCKDVYVEDGTQIERVNKSRLAVRHAGGALLAAGAIALRDSKVSEPRLGVAKLIAGKGGEK